MKPANKVYTNVQYSQIKGIKWWKYDEYVDYKWFQEP